MSSDVVIHEIEDERDPLTDAALGLVAAMFDRSERQSVEELRSEVEEKRRGLLMGYEFHVLAACIGQQVAGTAIGVYLGGVNAGFITYLAVDPAFRARQIARSLRFALIERFRADARNSDWPDVDWILGEVRVGSPWLARLVRERGAIPFDLTYYHPGMDPGSSDREYLLYRQPIADTRRELPVQLVRRILYAIYRRGYRVKYPLARPAFRAMLDELEEKTTVGVHPSFDSVVDYPA